MSAQHLVATLYECKYCPAIVYERTYLPHLHIEVGVDGPRLSQETLELQPILQPDVVVIAQLAAQVRSQLCRTDHLVQLVYRHQLGLPTTTIDDVICFYHNLTTFKMSTKIHDIAVD